MSKNISDIQLIDIKKKLLNKIEKRIEKAGIDELDRLVHMIVSLNYIK